MRYPPHDLGEPVPAAGPGSVSPVPAEPVPSRQTGRTGKAFPEGTRGRIMAGRGDAWIKWHIIFLRCNDFNGLEYPDIWITLGSSFRDRAARTGIEGFGSYRWFTNAASAKALILQLPISGFRVPLTRPRNDEPVGEGLNFAKAACG